MWGEILNWYRDINNTLLVYFICLILTFSGLYIAISSDKIENKYSRDIICWLGLIIGCSGPILWFILGVL